MSTVDLVAAAAWLLAVQAGDVEHADLIGDRTPEPAALLAGLVELADRDAVDSRALRALLGVGGG